VEAEATVARLTEQLDRVARAAPPPPPGTTLSAALNAECEDLAQRPAGLPGSLAAGYQAGRAAFLNGLRARASNVRRAGPDDARPYPGSDEPPGKPAEAYGYYRFLIAKTVPGVPEAAERQLAEAQAALNVLEQRILELRARQSRYAARISAADARWRNALAAHLRAHADEVAARSGYTDAFTIGYNLAADSLARRLRQRADEIAVPTS
jgi:hypothetical protein